MAGGSVTSDSGAPENRTVLVPTPGDHPAGSKQPQARMGQHDGTDAPLATQQAVPAPPVATTHPNQCLAEAGSDRLRTWGSRRRGWDTRALCTRAARNVGSLSQIRRPGAQRHELRIEYKLGWPAHCAALRASITADSIACTCIPSTCTPFKSMKCPSAINN